jgi:hypothetical protein
MSITVIYYTMSLTVLYQYHQDEWYVYHSDLLHYVSDCTVSIDISLILVIWIYILFCLIYLQKLYYIQSVTAYDPKCIRKYINRLKRTKDILISLRRVIFLSLIYHTMSLTVLVYFVIQVKQPTHNISIPTYIYFVIYLQWRNLPNLRHQKCTSFELACTCNTGTLMLKNS